MTWEQAFRAARVFATRHGRRYVVRGFRGEGGSWRYFVWRA